MENYTWNPVFNKLMELKKNYVNKTGSLSSYNSLYERGEFKTCVDKWIDATQDPFWISVRPFIIIKQDKSSVLFKYGNLAMLADLAADLLGISSPTELWEHWDGFLQYCRSVSIDLKSETIETAPFDKFFNIDEMPSSSWDVVKNLMENAESIEFSNKLDGSIYIVRYLEDEGRIVSHSSGCVSAAEEQASVLRAADKMFFSKICDSTREMVEDYPDYTFMFEYIAIDNPIVVKYTKDDEGMYLIGMRHNASGKMYSYNELRTVASKYPGVRVTTLFEGGLDVIMDLVHTKKSNEMEGFVINIDGHLFKLKTDDYVKIHKLISKLSAPNVILRAIADGIYDDLLAKVPDSYKEDVDKIARIVVKYAEDMEKTTASYYEKAPKEDKKDFMIWVNNNVPIEYQGAVRNLYLGKENNFLKRERGKGNYQYTRMSQIDPDFMDKLGGWGEEE